MAISGLGLWADDGPSTDVAAGSKEDETVLNQPVTPIRPNVPSRVQIKCYYASGYVRLGFPEGIYSATVTISNGEEEWFGFASVDEPLMETPVFTGDYTIECIADNGRLFTGTLHF